MVMAAKHWPNSFENGERIIMSSFMPKKKTNKSAAATYCRSVNTALSQNSKVEIIIPAKIAKPPNVGTLDLCSFLLSGSSNKCLSCAT